ncbi:SDR family NAD(P)-dependent oxidoreductase [Streptomyces sp. NPDC005438]|uniref:SDR family NAD(P)-dependent oxidoreductase n=1 Tax=Streptomyces sp. NPDC005438 TaxID=3156880 RepID=UPI0033B61B56
MAQVPDSGNGHRNEPVAIVGLSCRLPKAPDPSAFWKLLCDEVSAITEVPEGREPAGGRWGAFLDRVEEFDADFFGVTPREAAVLDPQQRLMLELVWSALEDARTVPATLRGSATGVFVGAMRDDYALLLSRAGQSGRAEVNHHAMTGVSRGLIANRVSHFLGLRGPSMVIDAGQASSLVAVHNAVRSLQRGESRLAVAGGVNLHLAAETATLAEEFGGLSPDGHCYTFDARANGFVRGEGGAVLILRPLSDAVAAGDRVYGVIRGGAVNNDGGTDGLTVPSQSAQAEVLRQAYASADVPPAAVGYVELHGTGTPVGDPVEATALGEVLGSARDADQPLLVGSVKTNLGHLESAAGVTGLVKVLLALRHERIPASLNYESGAPELRLEERHLRVVGQAVEWPHTDRPRVAGVSAFGMGGTNCHLVVEEAPTPETPLPLPPPERSTPPVVLPWVLSGRTDTALQQQAAALAEVVHDADPVDVGWSLATTRTPFERRAVVTGDHGPGLAALADGDPAAGVVSGAAGPVGLTAFVFPGQGAQWVGMGRELLAASAVFAEGVAECERAFEGLVDWSLTEVLRGEGEAASLERVDVVQPASFAVMVSLARLWRSYGVEPDAVVGHSQGEIAAACVAGTLSLEDGARVVCLRSRAIAELADPGAMASVDLPADEAEALLEPWADRAAVGVVNSPSQVVVSGAPDAVEAALAECERREVRCRRIAVDYASHSPAVDVLRDRLAEELAGITPRVGQVPMMSSVTGDWADPLALGGAYWFTNLRQRVRFADAVRHLADEDYGVFVECSSHPVLVAAVQATCEESGNEPDVSVGSLRRDEGGMDRLTAGLSELWVRGADVDWEQAFADARPRTVDLPTYPFQHRRHWFDTVAADTDETTAHTALVRLAEADHDERPRLLRDVVRAHAAAVLGHGEPEAVAPATTFKDAGFDSQSSLQLRGRLCEVLNLSLPSTVLFDHPTPDRLARWLSSRLPTTLQAPPAPEPTPAPDRTPAQATDRDTAEPVAIVGMGCRLPGGVRGPEDLWRLVLDGTDAISAFPTDRGWDLGRLFADSEQPGGSSVDQGGFLYDAGDFDAEFFGISPREALAMDPQQRLLLETSWEALERAGIDPSTLTDTPTGVFVGAMAQEYGPRLHEASDGVEGFALTGTTNSALSGRISYVLGLQGPSLTVDTACSASLVALHLAVRALRSGECTLALAGAATVMARPGIFVEFSRQRGLAPDGRCKAFADDADGTGWSEGVGSLVLERLSDARRNGHPVLAVLSGTAVNSDGASNGLTAPNGPSQQAVIRQALADAGVRPEQVHAVEAHGTGTTLGDPIEASSLIEVYGSAHSAQQPLWLGSLKSNIGHAQAAAGMAGVIKTVLALQHQTLPRTLHVRTPSQHVDWSDQTVRLLTEPVPWPTGDEPRRAGVSAFGVSGTNAHVILSEAPQPDQAEPTPVEQESGPLPFALSARSPRALGEQARRLRAALRREGAPRLADVSHTLAHHRAHLPHRAVIIADGTAELDPALAALAEDGEHASLLTGTPAGDDPLGRPVFVFPGQGGQWQGMAVELAGSSPVFAEALAECEAALGEFVDWSLSEVLRGEGGDANLERVDVVQPALFAVMVSLARSWRSFGVEPGAVVGHSQGEIAAACVAGALSLRDAARVVCLRSRTLLGLAGQGTMASVSLPAAEVAELIRPWGDRISLATHNGPSTVVVSGQTEAVAELLAQCEQRAIHARGIPVDYASHSAHVESLRDELAELLAPVTPRRADVPFYSTVTAGVLDGTELTGDYWYRNLRGTVRFEEVTRLLAQDGHRVFVETGPHPTLGIAVQQTLEDAGVRDGATLGSLRRDEGGLDRFLRALGEAHCLGLRPRWSTLLDRHQPRTVDLPTYPFERRRYWWTPPAPRPEDAAAPTPADGAASWRYDVTWRPLPEPDAQVPGGSWLVLTDTVEDEPQRQVLAALRDARVDVLHRPLPERTPRALREALADTGTVDGVLCLLTPAEGVGPATQVEALGGLLRAAEDSGLQAPVWCATQGAVRTGPSDAPPDLSQAALWGAGRAAALEHPDRWGGLIDLPTRWDSRCGERLVALLARAGDTPGQVEDQVAVRASGVLARRLVRASRGPAQDTFTPRGTALITGGTGSLGTRLARWLAEQGAPRVLLASRRGGTPESAALAEELAEQGTEVVTVACDTTDRDALATLLADIGTEQPLSSVFHAAGAVALGRLDEVDAEETGTVLGAKVDGAVHLDELLADTPLDAFVLFSSISGTWGVADHGTYGAANACLDALAQRRRAEGRTATSIAWGPWGGGGMIDESRFAGLAATGLPVLDPERAMEALRLVLDHDETALAVADVDWDLFGPVFTSSRPSPLLAELYAPPASEDDPDSQEPSAGFRSRLDQLPAGERREAVLTLVREHAARVLGHDGAGAVDSDRAFRDVGFDSLTAVELRNRLVNATGLTLATTLVFNHPTPSLLADHLYELLGGAPASEGAVTVARSADPDEPLAIVGMACRLPGGVATPRDLWRLLTEGREGVGGLPQDRGWDLDSLYDPDPARHGTSYTRAGGFLPRAGDFDHEFFGVSAREALAMDPQQRLLLEATWEAFENAGILPADLRGTETGVFAGALTPDYGQPHGMPGELEGYHVTGSAPSVASGRLAYTFGLTGPAITVDTACSSSLVALHMAARSLHSGECQVALVAGASVMSTPGPMVSFSRQRALSEDGRCRSFSEDADGFGMAEGVGVLILERLSDAQRHGHRVWAVVRGSAVNQDGASNGLTAPNGPSQERVIQQALANAGVTASEVDAVEAHGTGTSLGDPIEAQALLATYGQDRPDDQPLWLGSLKSNIGHTQAAAGVAGIIKMALALSHRTLPRTLHVERPTTQVDWESGRVRLLAEEQDWPEGDRPRRAAVSAFGISGTNAHVILEQAPQEPETAPATQDRPAPTVVPWLLSARTPQALGERAGALIPLTGDTARLADIGHALATTRTHFEQRAVVVGDLHAGLTALAEGRPASQVASDVAGPLGRPVFVFPGQGAQWQGMAVELAGSSPVFAEALAECEAALGEFVGWSLSEVLRGEGGDASLERVDVVQPASFAVMVSLARLWRSFGVEPGAVVGHSQGEIAAACVAGALSLRDAALVVCLRSRLITAVAGDGGMATVALPADEVERLLPEYQDRLSLAASNGPRSSVVAGDRKTVEEFVEARKDSDVRAKLIAVDYASHSHHVEPILDQLARELLPLRPMAPQVPFLSTVTGEWIEDADLDAAYWCDNLRQPVRFDQAVRTLADGGYGLFVENSPHPVLLAALEEAVEDSEQAYAVGSLRRDDGGLDRFLLSLGQAWARGASVDWTPALPPTSAPVDLPTYPFQRRRHWIEPPEAVTARTDRATIDGWRYRTRWIPVDPTGASELPGDWLVVAPEDAAELSATVEAVVKGLTHHGATVHRHTVAELPEALSRLSVPPAGVLSLVSLDERPVDGQPVAVGLAESVAVVRELASAAPDTPLWMATRGAVRAVDGDTVGHPLQAPVWGLGTVLGLDEPQRWSGRIDLPATLDEPAVERLAEALAAVTGENEVAVRADGTYARRLVTDPAGDASPWRPRDTVLITGGTGALGAHVARWAAAKGASHLVLVSRQGPEAPGADALHEELTALGAEVTLAACDVADREELAALLDGLPEDRPLRAVVHAAGLTQDEVPVAELTVEELARTARVKIDGARNLDALTRDHELDAFVLFSSGAGTWGETGKGGYAAANAYLDALAENRRARGLPATSVAWGAWGGGGMVEGEVADLLTRRGTRLMRPELAVRALADAVGNGDTCLAVSSFDLSRFLSLYTMSRERPLVAELRAGQTANATADEEPESTDARPEGDLAKRLAGLSQEEQDQTLVDLVRREAAAVLKAERPEEIKPRKAFRELGFDSLTALEFRNRMNVATGMRLSATLIFDHPNPSVLARYLRRELTDGASSVPADLDRLEASLAALPTEAWAELDVADRLRTLLRRAEQGATGESGTTEEADEDLTAASNDEIFDLIDRELGI